MLSKEKKEEIRKYKYNQQIIDYEIHSLFCTIDNTCSYLSNLYSNVYMIYDKKKIYYIKKGLKFSYDKLKFMYKIFFEECLPYKEEIILRIGKSKKWLKTRFYRKKEAL